MAKEKKQSFESLQQRLEDIVHKLEAGGLELEESLKLFEEGTALFAQCSKMLDSAQTRMDVLFEEAGQWRVRQERDPDENRKDGNRKFEDTDNFQSTNTFTDPTGSVGLDGDNDE